MYGNSGMVHFAEINQTPSPYSMLQHIIRVATPKLVPRNYLRYLQTTLIMGRRGLVSEFMWCTVDPWSRILGSRVLGPESLGPASWGLWAWVVDPGSWGLGSWVLILDFAFYMRDLICRWFIAENTKIFRSYVKHCWIFPRGRNCRILIGLCE